MTSSELEPHARKKYLSYLGVVLSVSILFAAMWFLKNELAGMSRQAIAEQISSLPLLSLLLSVLFAACSYVALTLYDTLAIAYSGAKLSYKK